ncbi:MAG: hypothetical protein MJ228_04070 [Bacilli bacterium]|nr:hypothetical protein [Bacilli bacterium]
MKNRSKMILGLASMLGISAGAAAISGFAWFTTQRTADISASNFKVGSGDGTLKISSAGSLVNCAIETNANNTVAINPSTGELEDVSSGDGKTFHKVLLSTNKQSVDHIVLEDGSKSKVNTNQMVYISWNVKVENVGPGTKLNVFASNDGPIFKQNLANSKTTQNVVGDGTAKDFVLPTAFDKIESVKVGDTTLEAAKYTATPAERKISFTDAPAGSVEIVTSIDYSSCYRLAIYDLNDVSNATDDTLVYFYSAAGKTSYVKAEDKAALEDDDPETTATRNGSGTLTANDFISTSAAIISSTDPAASTANGVKPNNQLLIEDLIASTTSPVKDNSHTLRFVVWCEGTSTPDEAVVASNGVDLSLKLVGLTKAN